MSTLQRWFGSAVRGGNQRESIPAWQDIKELVDVHTIQLNAFQAFAEQSRTQWQDVQHFKPVVEEVQAADRMTKLLLMQAAQKLRRQRGTDSFMDEFSLELNKFLDVFLLSRLGCNMLMGQYLACTGASPLKGIVNPQCDAFEVCRKAADEVKRRCEISQGRVPIVHVEAFTMAGQGVTKAPRFSYIPGILMHIVRELLKNSCQRSLELAESASELHEMPIHVVVCADKRHVVIRITDRARGIPRQIGSKIWSYLYSGSPTAISGLSFGYGIGLPLSRLHARYLGGSLDLVSLPGYGVDAYLSLPRVEADLVEQVIADGCCPIHLRLQLSRVAEGSSGSDQRVLEQQLISIAVADSAADEDTCPRSDGLPPGDLLCLTPSDESKAGLSGHGLAAVALFLSLAELLEVRASNREAVQLVMQRSADGHAEQLCRVHDRIRTRLWMQRIEDVTAGTKDESVFETRLRRLADEALRTRMETEMKDALLQMEEQVRTFQGVVDRRLQEQEQTMKRMVEERVQQELDAILQSEMLKVHAMVEQKVRERVSAIFRREVQSTVQQLQAKLEDLARENAVLRDAFAEANLRSKCFFWALNPAPLQTTVALSCGLAPHVVFSLKLRTSIAATFPDIPEGFEV
ncbi:unnamed protein product [Effrenium voratum]|nr:unnamed protein product [Effrenium voratum]